MLYGIYVDYNVLSELYGSLNLFPTDAIASKVFASSLEQRENIDPSEFRFYKVGDFNIKTGEIFSHPAKLIPFNLRESLETPMEVKSNG